MKFRRAVTAALASALIAVPVCAADNEVTVMVNGEALELDRPPIMESGRVLVPFRAIFEALGAEVTYIEEPKSVMAAKGITDIYFEIGSDTIYIDNDAVKIDVPSRIVGNRTLVPVRAVSEGLDAEVDWNGETRTVTVNEKETDHKLSSGKTEKVIKTGDGTVIANMEFNYPIIENADNSEVIAALNELLKNTAEEAMAAYEAESIGDPSEHKRIIEMTGRPYEFCMNYGIMYDKNGYLSVKYESYANLNGAHPMTTVTSATYDTEKAVEITAAEVFVSDAAVKQLFVDKINADKDMFFGDALETVGKMPCDGFYLTEKGAVAYYNVYAIAAYAAGPQTVTAAYADNADLFTDDFFERMTDRDELAATEAVCGMLDGFCEFDFEKMAAYAPTVVAAGVLPYESREQAIDAVAEEMGAAAPEVEDYKTEFKAVAASVFEAMREGLSYEIINAAGENGKYVFDIGFTSYALENAEALTEGYDAELVVAKLIDDGTVNDAMTDAEMEAAVVEAVLSDIVDYVKERLASGKIPSVTEEIEITVENTDGEWLVTGEALIIS